MDTEEKQEHQHQHTNSQLPFQCEYELYAMKWKARAATRNPISHDGFLIFQYPCYLKINSSKPCNLQGTQQETQLAFMVAENCNEYNAVVNALKWNGLYRSDNLDVVNMYWGKPLKEFEHLWNYPFQKVNHLPGNHALAGKLYLAAHANYFQELHPECAIIPETFLLPKQRDMLLETLERDGGLWIYKPSNGSCGSGIHLFSNPAQLTTKQNRAVASRYIGNPLLINGLKFDLRLYVAVTSIDPMHVYIFDDGLVRFATEEYDSSPDTATNLCIHLTNYSINKGSQKYVKTGKLTEYDERGRVDVVCDSGSKWSYKALIQFLKNSTNIDTDLLEHRINKLIVHTMISVESTMRKKLVSTKCPRSSCFENLGFDILIDENLQPWLLEVNTYPSLSSSSPMDKAIKTKLTTDLFNLLLIPSVCGREWLFGDSKWDEWFNVRYSSERTNELGELLSLPELDMDYLNSHPEDILLLKALQYENLRKRHFRRIFPPEKDPELGEVYSQLFAEQTYNNVLLKRFLELSPQKQEDLLQSMGL